MNQNDEIRGRLKRAFETACNAYLQAFCEKHDYDYEDAANSWVGGEVGGITKVSDYFIDLQTIRTDIDKTPPPRRSSLSGSTTVCGR